MVAWMGFIFSLSSRSFSEDDPSIAWATWLFSFLEPLPKDKLVHFGLYFILGAFGCFAMGQKPLLNFAICSLYGISDEWHQSFVPQRSPDPLDWVADTLGAGIAIALHEIWRRKRGRGEKNSPS